jgi:hypothetical protein
MRRRGQRHVRCERGAGDPIGALREARSTHFGWLEISKAKDSREAHEYLVRKELARERVIPAGKAFEHGSPRSERRIAVDACLARDVRKERGSRSHASAGVVELVDGRADQRGAAARVARRSPPDQPDPLTGSVRGPARLDVCNREQELRGHPRLRRGGLCRGLDPSLASAACGDRDARDRPPHQRDGSRHRYGHAYCVGTIIFSSIAVRPSRSRASRRHTHGKPLN